jgi:hypothetical protein
MGTNTRQAAEHVTDMRSPGPERKGQIVFFDSRCVWLHQHYCIRPVFSFYWPSLKERRTRQTRMCFSPKRGLPGPISKRSRRSRSSPKVPPCLVAVSAAQKISDLEWHSPFGLYVCVLCYRLQDNGCEVETGAMTTMRSCNPAILLLRHPSFFSPVYDIIGRAGSRTLDGHACFASTSRPCYRFVL